MKRRLNEQGVLNTLLIPLVISIVGFFGALGFGMWAFYERNDYKNNVDTKIATAVEVSNEKIASAKDNEFLEREKFPLTEYQSPAQFGSIKVNYPKTWSAYVQNDKTATYVFDPKFVPAGENTPHALKITVEDVSYDESITKYEGQVEEGLLKAVAYSLPKVSKVVGVKFDGEVEEGRIESVIVLPLRDKTITISSQTSDRFKDFNEIILPSITFSP